MQPQNISEITLQLERWVSANNYSGYDPYDGLRSRLLRFIPLPGKYAKIAWIQFFKKCPVNLRPLFLVPRGKNPKGIGLFLSAYVHLFRATGQKCWLEKAEALALWLDAHAEKGYSGKCWGYNFDWQSRAFFVPKGTPTIVNTAFVAHAFLDLFEVTQEAKWLNVAESACSFILNDLNRYEADDSICFSYTPIDEIRVHNANLLGAGLLARASGFLRSTHWRTEITRAAEYTIRHQRDDGSWFYAETDYQDWIDSFHTGFNLMSLRYIQEYLQSGKIRKAIERGEVFYAENFFLPDGTPKYYHDRVYPLDVHAPAMALRYFSALPQYRPLVDKISGWFVRNMRQSSGCFVFQKNRFSIFGKQVTYSNTIPYIRWAQAWSLYGLTYLQLTQYDPKPHKAERANLHVDDHFELAGN